MNIYETLKNDHATMRTLLSKLVAAAQHEGSNWQELLSEISAELVPHSRAEEAVLYNAMRALNAGGDKVMHGYKEHLEAETILRSLQAMSAVDVHWTAAALKLQEALNHHMEEEEDEIFSAAQKVFSEEEANELAGAFKSSKAQVKPNAVLGSVAQLVANLLPPRLTEAMARLGNNA